MGWGFKLQQLSPIWSPQLRVPVRPSAGERGGSGPEFALSAPLTVLVILEDTFTRAKVIAVGHFQYKIANPSLPEEWKRGRARFEGMSLRGGCVVRL